MRWSFLLRLLAKARSRRQGRQRRGEREREREREREQADSELSEFWPPRLDFPGIQNWGTGSAREFGLSAWAKLFQLSWFD